MGGPRKYSILYNYAEIKNSKNNIVLLGEVGSGKTTIINKLCNSDFQTGSDCKSVTNEVQIVSDISYRNIIFDFPGFKVMDDFIPIFEVQYRTLRNIPIKAICFVIERRDRLDLMADSLISLKETFEEYTANIIVIITKTESYDENKKNEVKNYLKDKTKFEKIIFTKKDTRGRELLDQIILLKNGMENLEEINPKSREFIRHFKRATEDNMKRAKKQYTDEFKDALDIFQEEFNKPTTDKALKRALYFAFRDFKNNLIERYYEVAKREQVISDSVIEHVLSFSNQIYHEFEEFRIKTEREIEVNISNYSGHVNQFKKCPHCGTIWFKFTGCDGKTRCGNRDKVCDRDKFCGIYKDYKVQYENNNLTIQKTDVNQPETFRSTEFLGLTNEEIQMNNSLRNEGKVEIKPIGCGNWINWKEMEDVTEAINETLQNICNRDYDIKFREIKEKEEKQKFSDQISFLNQLK
jgi:GTPase SAR1 family protein